MPRNFTHFNNLFLAVLRRRLSWETALLAAAVLCAVQVGGTKGQRGEPGGRDLAATNAAGAAAAPARSSPADRLGLMDLLGKEDKCIILIQLRGIPMGSRPVSRYHTNGLRVENGI